MAIAVSMPPAGSRTKDADVSSDIGSGADLLLGVHDAQSRAVRETRLESGSRRRKGMTICCFDISGVSVAAIASGLRICVRRMCGRATRALVPDAEIQAPWWLKTLVDFSSLDFYPN